VLWDAAGLALRVGALAPPRVAWFCVLGFCVFVRRQPLSYAVPDSVGVVTATIGGRSRASYLVFAK
jgi:hypothetical protein